jgi:hypothetical protein
MRPADYFVDPTGHAPDGSPASTRATESATPASAEAFAVALRAAIATGATEADLLRAALLTFVTDLRVRGEPPERALIAVKERVLIAMQRRSDLSRADAGALLRRIVHWTIEAYYRAD